MKEFTKKEPRKPIRTEKIIQNRRVTVAMFLQAMPDGVTHRVMQILDAPLPFENHPDFLRTLNNCRKEIFKDKGVLCETKNTEIPDDPTITVHIRIINSRTGKLINQKVMTGPEAKAFMHKTRMENEERKLRVKEIIENQPSFGSNLGDLIKEAQSEVNA